MPRLYLSLPVQSIIVLLMVLSLAGCKSTNIFDLMERGRTAYGEAHVALDR